MPNDNDLIRRGEAERAILDSHLGEKFTDALRENFTLANVVPRARITFEDAVEIADALTEWLEAWARHYDNNLPQHEGDPPTDWLRDEYDRFIDRVRDAPTIDPDKEA